MSAILVDLKNMGALSLMRRITELEAQLAAPRKQITADDVTDEMIDELARQCPTYNTVEVDRQTIAASVNIYLGTKK